MGHTATDAAATTTGVMAKTEAGEGMFGADLDMDSLTDSEDDDGDDLSSSDDLADVDNEFKTKKAKKDK